MDAIVDCRVIFKQVSRLSRAAQDIPQPAFP
jgi:hypothetical protein